MSDARQQAVERACRDLIAAGEPVTFSAVSERSEVPRVTLYRNPDLRALVEDHRARHQAATTLAGLAGELANLRLTIEALAERVRRHDEQLRQLRRRK